MQTDYQIQCFDDLKLSGYRFCGVSPQALFIISHGMAETIERYRDFSMFLAENQICVYGHSHRGHGRSITSENALGHLNADGWMRMREELKAAVLLAKSEFPDLPVYLMGHSMGSFLVRDFLITEGALLDGVILSGTGFPSKGALVSGGLLATVESAVLGSRHPSKRLTSITFGAYNKKIDHPKTAFDWLSCDPEMVAAYIDDPLCGNMHTAGFYQVFFKNLKRILHNSNPPQLQKKIPIHLISGDEDPVGDYGKGVIKSEKYYAQLGFDTSLRLYKGGRHEMLNAPERQSVYNDILEWLHTQRLSN